MPNAQRRERAVRAGVRVAADHRHPGQGRALLRADHMDDALAAIAKWKIRLGAVRLDVGVERLDLRARNGVADALGPNAASACCGPRWRRSTRPARVCGPRAARPFIRLRARHLVDQMPVDVDERRAVRFGADDMGVPEFVVERTRMHGRVAATRVSRAPIEKWIIARQHSAVRRESALRAPGSPPRYREGAAPTGRTPLPASRAAR